jgi:molybdopterin-guanine dinucleotide biosynthesis protein A
MCSAGHNAAITGLVLAGGQSRRMGRDKGSLEYHDMPQVRYVWRMLSAVCNPVYVSAQEAQLRTEAYRDLPIVADASEARGPAAGLLGAWSMHPDTALLVLAVDMPLVDLGMLRGLLAARHSGRLATVFAHPDGTPEPLCTLWEAEARGYIVERAQMGAYSLRELLASSSVMSVEAVDPSRLVGVNTVEDYNRIRRRLDAEVRSARS